MIFYLMVDLRYLQQLMDRVANHYKNSSPSIGCKWRLGELVVAQYTEDNGFYRAKILSLSGNFAEVNITHQSIISKVKHISAA